MLYCAGQNWLGMGRFLGGRWVVMAIDGTYRGRAHTLFGSSDFEMVLRTYGTELTGNMSAIGVTADISGGTVSGDSFSCRLETTFQGQRAVLDVRGSVQGDTVVGTTSVGVISARFTGTRV